MLKIDKYIRVVRNLPQISQLKYMSSRNEGCCKNCPPSYYCVQPENEDGTDFEKLKQKIVHPFFKKKCPKNPKTLKNIALFICLPAIFVVGFDCFVLNPEKKKRPKFIKFTYLRIRRKPYPWDPVRTLFHNPVYNALPDGYETEVPEEDEIDPFSLIP